MVTYRTHLLHSKCHCVVQFSLVNQDLETIAVTDEIGGQLETLMAEIQNKLSGAALNFYKREFDFFFQITDISRIIK